MICLKCLCTLEQVLAQPGFGKDMKLLPQKLPDVAAEGSTGQQPLLVHIPKSPVPSTPVTASPMKLAETVAKVNVPPKITRIYGTDMVGRAYTSADAGHSLGKCILG